MKAQLEFSRKMIQAYNEIFKPLCHKGEAVPDGN